MPLALTLSRGERGPAVPQFASYPADLRGTNPCRIPNLTGVSGATE
jgi:hypothetical protein